MAEIDALGNIAQQRLHNQHITHRTFETPQALGTFKKNAVVIEANPFAPLDTSATLAFATAAKRFGAFLGMPVVSPFRGSIGT